MRRLMFAAAFVLSGAASAQDAKPVPPAPKVAAQPNPFARTATVTAAQMTKLEEEVETLEAHREVKKGHVKAAELGVRVAELEIEHLTELATRGVVPKSELQKAKIAVEAAKIQMEIRAAELKEVDVKIKYAKKRLEEAKAAGVRPAPGGRGEPKVVDPPAARGAEDKAIAELRAKLDTVSAELAKKIVEVKTAEEGVKVAEEVLEGLKKSELAGVNVTAKTRLDAQLTAAKLKEKLEKLSKERTVLQAEAEALRKLKELNP